jgi:aminoglycoside 3-N-acetyltransferase
MEKPKATVTQKDIERGLRSLGITGGVEVHASLSSFGSVEAGADAVVDALLAAFPLVMVPAFTWLTWASPPSGVHYERNGAAKEWLDIYARPGQPWRPDMPAHKRIGAIPETLRKRPGVLRSHHPTHSFAAIGQGAAEILGVQSIEDILAPIEELLVRRGGWVLMLGARINSCTAIHQCERMAGRPYFIRWAYDETGKVVEMRVPMCTGGYLRFESLLAPVKRETKIGNARVVAYPGAEFMRICTDAIRANREILVCRPDCVYCHDQNAGGPYRKE